MRWLIAGLLWPLCFAATTALAQSAKPPFADGPDEKLPDKPANRTWTVAKDGYAFTFLFEPGIPDPKQTIEVLLIASQIPKTPHPRFGSRVPLDDAAIHVDIANPAGEVIGRYVVHEIPLTSGKYGFHYTATSEGIHSLTLGGQTADGKPLSAELKLPVAVWPLPKELEGTGDGEAPRSARRVIRKPLIKKVQTP